jgi:hypothetical protein
MTDEQIEDAYFEWVAEDNNYYAQLADVWMAAIKWMQEQMKKEFRIDVLGDDPDWDEYVRERIGYEKG